MTIELDTTIETKSKRREWKLLRFTNERDEMGNSMILRVLGMEIFHKKVKRVGNKGRQYQVTKCKTSYDGRYERFQLVQLKYECPNAQK